MSQDPKIRDDKRIPRFSNRSPNEDPNAPKKGPKFSIYWVYAIILAVLIGFNFFTGALSGNMAKTSSLDFRSMLANGDIAKYTIIDNKKTVKIFLTTSGLNRHREEIKKR